MMKGWIHGMTWVSEYGWRTVTLNSTVQGSHMKITLLYDENDAHEIKKEKKRHVFCRDNVYVTFFDRQGNFTLNMKMAVVYEPTRVRFSCRAKGGSMLFTVKTNVNGVGKFQFISNMKKYAKFYSPDKKDDKKKEKEVSA